MEKGEIKINREKCSKIDLAKSKCDLELKDIKEKYEESQKQIKDFKLQITKNENKFKKDLYQVNEKLRECEEQNNKNKDSSDKIIFNLRNQITIIKNEFLLKIKIFKTENENCNSKIRLLEDKLKLYMEEKEKCRKEIFEIKNNNENNLKINIKTTKNDLDSLRDKLKTCNEQKTTIINNYEKKINGIKKTCAENEEKISIDCSSKNEVIMREMERFKEKYNKIISEKNTEIVELRQLKVECDKNLETNRKEIIDFKNEILSLKNQLLICTTNIDSSSKNEMSLKIKIENLNILVSQYFLKIKTCEDDSYKLKEEINRLNFYLQDLKRKITNTNNDKDSSIELLECQNIVKLKDIEINNLKREKSISLEKCEILIFNNFVNNSSCKRFDKLTGAVLSVCGEKSKKIRKSENTFIKLSKTNKEEKSNEFITSMASAHRYDNLVDEGSMFAKLNRGSSIVLKLEDKNCKKNK
jgi:chromosome segregation ATPase